VDNGGSRPLQSVSRENSWSNEPSAVDSSQSSDHRTVSEIVSSESEMAKSGPGAKRQIHISSRRPMPSTGLADCKSPDVLVDDACKPPGLDVSSKSAKSSEVTEQPVDVCQLPQTVVCGTRAVSHDDTLKQSCENEICSEKTASDFILDDSLDKRLSLDTVDSRDDREKSDADSTPTNELSVKEEDISVHLDDAVSENQTSSTLASQTSEKTSPVHAECRPLETELHKTETLAPDVNHTVRQASPECAAGGARKSPEEDKYLTQVLGSCNEDISVSSHSTRSQREVQSAAGGQPSTRSHSASSRHSASGASRAGSGSSGAAVVESDRSDRADTVSSRSEAGMDSIHSSISSRARSVDSNRSSRSNSIHTNGSSKTGSVYREVSGRAESVQSNVSSKTYTLDTEGSGKADSVHSASQTSCASLLEHKHHVAVPDSADNCAGSEVQQRLEDVGADTDDDVTDLEPDHSLQIQPVENVDGIVSEVSTVPQVIRAEAEERQEVGLDEEVLNLKDEELPEELDSDSDLNDDVRGSVHSAFDTGSVARNTSEPLSDTSESRTGRKSDDLHRIISKVAAAVESFATEGEDTSTKSRHGDLQPLVDDRCEKAADGATETLLTDAIDQMLAVRNHKMAAAVSHVSAIPAVSLSPSALSDSAKSTASTSSDGQVCSPFSCAAGLQRTELIVWVTDKKSNKCVSKTHISPYAQL